MFNVGLLEPYGEDPIGRPEWAMPAPEIVENAPSYLVAEVDDSWWYGMPKAEFLHRFVQYLVNGEGYGPEANS